ncbi:MAG TPA: cytochrome c3 family protein [Vicinamibacterales bacterium]|jgi:hypothetical protein|nr:cytochrome c3 family protein [Vicinamibacterales bacterium]
MRLHLPLLIAGAVLVGLIQVRSTPRVVPERAISSRPVQVQEDGYVSSSACRACHPREYQTWRASYHRTMTTRPTPETVVPDFREVDLDAPAGRVHLSRDADGYWAQFTDPDDSPGGVQRRIRRQILLVTGSHHQQVFWYPQGRGRLLGQLPVTYLTAERRWILRTAAFLQPPVVTAPSETGHWNAICVGCHATGGRSLVDPPLGTVPLDQIDADTRVAEFGIACEACHGPAASHVRANWNPLRRYALHLTNGTDPTTVQPDNLTPKASSEVCGQCHSVWEPYDERGERAANQQGFAYRPGGELRDTRFIAQPSRDSGSATMMRLLQQDPGFVADSFWPDGMVSVSGREYNGLIDSPCYVNGAGRGGTMTCSSCHAMHQPVGDTRSPHAWAANQLKPGMDGNDACLQCHGSLAADPGRHTHHKAESAGSSCYNCHMPYTTYGLLKGLRSHQVTSPDVRVSVRTGRPNACNLCHANRSMGWAAEALGRWYGVPAPVLDPDESTIAASILWMMRGDARQRALAAYNLGRFEASGASGAESMAPFLAVLLDDPYDAVRFVAYRSLRTLPGFERFDYDYLASAGERRRARLRATDAWRRTHHGHDAAVLIDAQGGLRRDEVDRLLRNRNNRFVFMRE